MPGKWTPIQRKKFMATVKLKRIAKQQHNNDHIPEMEYISHQQHNQELLAKFLSIVEKLL